MRALFVDTNSVNEDGSLCVSEFIINNMNLTVGERVIVYQEEDSWDAEIVYSRGKWGVKLISDIKEVSKERQEGHSEGFWEGYYVQSLNILRVLKNLNYSSNEIEIIKLKLGIK